MPGVWHFAPNSDTGGGSSWLLESGAGPLLIDAPALSQANLDFLEGKIRRLGEGSGGDQPHTTGWILFTGRAGHGRARHWQRWLGWPVLVQEQEAYLLPGVERVATFSETHQLAEGVRLLWTPGPSPGACVIHVSNGLWGNADLLCCGRLLVPVACRALAPLRRRGTFHWPRQLRSVKRLREWLMGEGPEWIATGAPTGGLRGQPLVGNGVRLLAELDLDALADAPVSRLDL
jgi:glyoxylase-like metal-dependent hydrolase (beta-lactamase superfamily II)